MRLSDDIETSLYDELYKYGYSVSAHSIPESLGDTIPHIHVTRTGGYESDRVIEFHNVDFDIYAANAADAMEYACALCDWVRGLEGGFCYAAELLTLPYNNPDPRHYNLARATFKALITKRMKGA